MYIEPQQFIEEQHSSFYFLSHLSQMHQLMALNPDDTMVSHRRLTQAETKTYK